MKKTNRVILIISLIIFSACSSQLAVDWTDKSYSDRTYSKIAVIGIGKDLQTKVLFEEVTVERFQKEGINAVVGVDIFKPNMPENEKNNANYLKIVKENNLDGIITVSLVDVQESSRYEQGENYTIPAGYSRFGRYWVQRYATVRSPGYYVDTKEYLIEANLYNLKGELTEDSQTLVWTGQSSLVDPSSPESGSKSFSKKMVNHLVKNGIVKAK